MSGETSTGIDLSVGRLRRPEDQVEARCRGTRSGSVAPPARASTSPPVESVQSRQSVSTRPPASSGPTRSRPDGADRDRALGLVVGEHERLALGERELDAEHAQPRPAGTCAVSVAVLPGTRPSGSSEIRPRASADHDPREHVRRRAVGPQRERFRPGRDPHAAQPRLALRRQLPRDRRRRERREVGAPVQPSDAVARHAEDGRREDGRARARASSRSAARPGSALPAPTRVGRERRSVERQHQLRALARPCSRAAPGTRPGRRRRARASRGRRRRRAPGRARP